MASIYLTGMDEILMECKGITELFWSSIKNQIQIHSIHLIFHR